MSKQAEATEKQGQATTNSEKTEGQEQNTPSIDHDRLFKELLATFFLEFLKLFFPAILEYLDSDSLVALDKEVFTDVTAGEKHEVDLIMRAAFKPVEPSSDSEEVKGKERGRKATVPTGTQAYFIIHVEAQSSKKPDFPSRMFVYFARLFEKYHQPIYPIAVFSYDKPKNKAATRYEMNFPHKKVVTFNYDVVQLNKLDWHKYKDNPNPVASALMAKMQIAPEDRPIVKLECLKILVGLKLDPAKTQLISGFINTYLRLDPAEKQVFEAKLQSLEPYQKKEQIMQVTNEWIEEGIEEGIVRGREEGRVEGQLKAISIFATSKFGQPLSERVENQLRKLGEDKLTNLLQVVFSFNSLQDLTDWLNNVSIQN